MPLLVNLRHLEAHNLKFRGELPVTELDLEVHDEMVRAEKPLRYELEIQAVERGLLVQGRLDLILQCQCVRCLKPFEHALVLEDWTRLLALDGEEKVAVVSDCVDLTPCLREDILLEFPQHPLCETNCPGLPKSALGQTRNTGGSRKTAQKSSAWAELDKLKF